MIRHPWTPAERARIVPAAFEVKGDEKKLLALLSRELGFPVNRAQISAQLRDRDGIMLGDVLKRAKFEGAPPAAAAERTVDDDVYEERIAKIQRDLKEAKKRNLSDEIVKREIIELKRLKPEVPDWTIHPKKSAHKCPGAPSALLSDIHFNEVVDPAQIEFANEYDIAIAEERLRRFFQHTVELCMEHMVRPQYPGIVLNLGGDNDSGDIHDELTASNEMPWAPAFLKLQGSLLVGIRGFADEFGKVHVVAVPGNHARTTKKPTAKGYNYTNRDWLLYQQLRKLTESDDRITWYVPDGEDAPYRIYGHRYLLSHGAQFRGGDGIIGPLGPITRGDNRKRARNVALGSEYDTLVIGHFHRLMMLSNLIANGSVVGYNEYAYKNNFPVDRPQQALWFTHPEHGITISMPVFVDGGKVRNRSPRWVEIPGLRAA